jgi:hypothetical protein
MLVYCAETRYYRQILSISYEYGSELRRRGILSPDALMDDGRPLYSLAEADIERAQAAVKAYRTRGQKKGELACA